MRFSPQGLSNPLSGLKLEGMTLAVVEAEAVEGISFSAGQGHDRCGVESPAGKHHRFFHRVHSYTPLIGIPEELVQRQLQPDLQVFVQNPLGQPFWFQLPEHRRKMDRGLFRKKLSILVQDLPGELEIGSVSDDEFKLIVEPNLSRFSRSFRFSIPLDGHFRSTILMHRSSTLRMSRLPLVSNRTVKFFSSNRLMSGGVSA